MSEKSDFKYPTFGKGLLAKGSFALLVGIVLGMALLNLGLVPKVFSPGFTSNGGQPLLKFSSYLELKDFLNASIGYNGRYYFEGVNKDALPPVPSLSPTGATDTSGGSQYSQTNIQVQGVDEADIVKTDGEFVYIISGQKIAIVKAYPPDAAKVIAEIKLNATVQGLFVNGDKLVILGASSQYYYLGADAVKESFVAPQGPIKGPQSFVLVYDITNRATPLLGRNVTMDGSYLNSRMIGDYVYVLFNSPTYIREDKEVYLPTIVDNGEVESVEPTDIYYSNGTDYSYSLTVIMAFNVKNEQEPINSENFLTGYTNLVYVSLNNLYLAMPRYWQNGTQVTEVHKIRIEKSDITYESNGQVPGYVLNQFSMDEYNANFRIATTTYNAVMEITSTTKTPVADIQNNVYVLNSTLGVIGKLESLAPGEQIYSARFLGERCYLVTFKKVDPLFVISLKDPTNPSILGKLKIPGYSDYLHPYDANHLIGIGKNAVEAKEGDFAWYQGVKISIFDVSDVEHPAEVANYVIGDRGTDSPVLRDHKALLFDKEKGIIAIPILEAKIDPSQYPEGVPDSAYGNYVWQGLYVLNINDNSLTLRGKVTHMENTTDLDKSGYYFDSEYSVERALYIENALYTLSPRTMKINDLTTLRELNKLELPFLNPYENTKPVPEPTTIEPSKAP